MAPMVSDDDIDTFVDITNAGRDVAINFLKHFNNDMQMAVSTYFDNPDKVFTDDSYDATAFAQDRYVEPPEIEFMRSFQIDHAPDKLNAFNPSAAPTRPPSRASQRAPDYNVDAIRGLFPKRRKISNDAYMSYLPTPLGNDSSTITGGNQEMGVVGGDGTVAPGIYFGPATKSSYDNSWALVPTSGGAASTTLEVIPDPDPPQRRRGGTGSGRAPAFLKPLPEGDRLPAMVSTIATIPLVRRALFNHAPVLEDYGYDPNWWSGAQVTAPEVIDLAADEADVFSISPNVGAHAILHETQRLVAFLQGTNRAYGSAEPLSRLPRMASIVETNKSKGFTASVSILQGLHEAVTGQNFDGLRNIREDRGANDPMQGELPPEFTPPESGSPGSTTATVGRDSPVQDESTMEPASPSKTKAEDKQGDELMPDVDAAPNSAATPSEALWKKLFHSEVIMREDTAIDLYDFWNLELTSEDPDRERSLYDVIDWALWAHDWDGNRADVEYYISRLADVFSIRVKQADASKRGLNFDVPARLWVDRWLKENVETTRTMRKEMAGYRAEIKELEARSEKLRRFRYEKKGYSGGAGEVKILDSKELLRSSITLLRAEQTRLRLVGFSVGKEKGSDGNVEERLVQGQSEEEARKTQRMVEGMEEKLEELNRKIEAVDVDIQRAQACLERFSKVWKEPVSSPDQAPRHKLNLCGFSTDARTMYIFDPRTPKLAESDAESVDPLSTPADKQWWKIQYLNDPRIVRERLTEEAALEAARTESRDVQLVYATDDALITDEEESLPPALAAFVSRDNDAFGTEMAIHAAELASPTDQSGNWGNPPTYKRDAEEKTGEKSTNQPMEEKPGAGYALLGSMEASDYAKAVSNGKADTVKSDGPDEEEEMMSMAPRKAFADGGNGRNSTGDVTMGGTEDKRSDPHDTSIEPKETKFFEDT
ncbi:hypothetical protein BDY21DRAFT_371879 [Lineolata rhizophorae]|uniref:Ubiquitin interaction domain-containing protein n=1 Tax=Lineolata rhizophorae TaxID=578093 RepID=A0A6A6NZS9_9PEZI|nr:hypothetical protein BDY21DRAFT_371879 [Lineolata rhizophorae]